MRRPAAILLTAFAVPLLACGPLSMLPSSPAPSGELAEDTSQPVRLSMPKDAAQRTLVQYGLAANGKPYSQGGHNPRDPVGRDGKPLPRIGPGSWDCSGLVYAAYQTIGITVGWVASQQQQDGRAIPCTLADLAGKATRCWQPGDLAFLEYNSAAAGADHVSMYIGDGLFADCLNWTEGCKVWRPAGYYYETFFAGARRILP